MLYSDFDVSDLEIDYQEDTVPNIKDEINIKPKQVHKEIMTPRLAAACNIRA